MVPAVTSQTPHERPLPSATILPKKAPEPKSLSPYDIRNFIDGETELDLTTLWQMLQIRTINFSRSDEFDPANYPFLGNCSGCQAEAFEYELDGQPGVEVLLKISDGGGRSSRYLVFSSRDGRWDEWKLLGHIDSDDNKYRMSQHKVFMGGGRNWLTISSQGASGTGVSLYLDRVFLVRGGRVLEVLSYVLEGHQGGEPDDTSGSFSGSWCRVTWKVIWLRPRSRW